MLLANHLTDRQREVLRLLSEDSTLSVTKMSEVLGVSDVTVRNDLNRLAAKGHIIRTRGGGLPAFHPSIVERQKQNVREKARIARAAADCIADGDNIMIIAGTTTALIAQHLLGKQDVHVVTNSTLLFPPARINPSVRITLVGGEFRPSAEALVGPVTLRDLEQFHVKTAFLGADGFSVDQGLTAHLVEIAEIVRRMARQAEQTVLVSDASKYGRAGFAHILPLGAVDRIITDTRLADHARRELEDLDITVARV